MKLETIYYCKRCGSTSIEVHMYVNVNTLEVEDYPEWDCKTPCWCNGCGDNSTITEDPDEWKEWKDLTVAEFKFEADRENDT